MTTGATPAQRVGQGILLMLLGMSVFSVMDALAKLLTERFDGFQITWARFAFTLLPLVLFAGPQRLRSMVRTARPLAQVTRGAVLVGSAACIILAFAVMPLAEVTAIAFAAPLIVVGLSAPLLGERVGWVRWAAVAAGFAGTLIVVWPTGGGYDLAGGLLAVGAALFWALGVLMTRTVRDEPPLTTLFYTALTATALMTLALPFVWRMPDARDWALMVALGLINGMANGLLILAVSRAPASVVAPFQYVQMLSATLLGWVLFAQLPTGRTLVGAAVIIASGLVVWHHERREAARPAPAPG